MVTVTVKVLVGLIEYNGQTKYEVLDVAGEIHNLRCNDVLLCGDTVILTNITARNDQMYAASTTKVLDHFIFTVTCTTVCTLKH